MHLVPRFAVVRLPARSTLVRLGRRLPPSVQRVVNAARGIDLPAVLDRPPATAVTVLAAEPADTVIGCGGTVRKHVRAGERVHLAVVSADGPDALGIDAPVDRLDLDDDDALGRALLRSGTDLVYAPNPVDAAPEHLALCRLLGRALPSAPSVRRVALYEVWTPVEANVVVDVTAEIEAKLEALARCAGGGDQVAAVRGLAAYRSAHGLHGRGSAEAFTVLRRGPFLDLLERLAHR